MKNPFLSVLVLVGALCGVMGQAAAVPLTQPGSPYSIFIYGETSNDPFTAIGTFDGAPTFYTRNNRALTLTESEIDLGGGKSLITIDLSADGDLFPSAGETGDIGLGVDGDGLDFLMPVSLESGIIRLFSGTTLLFTSDNQVPLIVPSFPWDGAFPSVGNVFGIGNVGGNNVTRFTFEFLVDGNAPGVSVPEPGSVMLGAIALLALGAARRRTQGPQR